MTKMTMTEIGAELASLRAAVAAMGPAMPEPVDGERAVLVTTNKRGVFFGYSAGHAGDDRVDVRGARMCLYWPRGGVLGLAEHGPVDDGFRIAERTTGVTEIPGGDVSSVTDCTAAATEAWKNARVYRG